MPAIDLSTDDIRAIAEYIHSILATARGQGNPPPIPPVTLNVLVGDAGAGRAYFEAKCSACHSVTGDLRGIGSRIASPAQLQNMWVAGGAGGRGGGTTPITAVVTLREGQKVEGRVIRSDDFAIALAMADGTSRSFRRDGDVPKVEIHNPREGHIKLLPGYTDKDIHDVTAYLVTTEMKIPGVLLLSLIGPAGHDLRRSLRGTRSRRSLISLSPTMADYSGDYTGRRLAHLTQINRSTVKNLTLAWMARLTGGRAPRGSGGRALVRPDRRSLWVAKAARSWPPASAAT